MADQLRVTEGSNVSPATFLAFLEQYDEADEEIAQAVAGRKDLRAKIKAAGIPLRSFDRARKDADVSAEKRNHEEAWYQTMMAWQGKPVPVGWQAEMDLGDPEALAERQLNMAERAGFARGKAGDKIDSNPWPEPGSAGHTRWINGWKSGQEAAVHAMPNGEGGAPKRKPGRPRKTEPAAPPADEPLDDSKDDLALLH